MRTVLEIGAGQGSLGARLSRRYDYVGLEPDARSFRVARTRLPAGRILNSTVESYASERPVDLVCAFEVLEHIGEDVTALMQWRRLVRAGGWLLLSVPAGRRLYGRSDAAVGHVRRYEPDELTAKLRAAGWEPVSTRRYGFPAGYALLVLWGAAALVKRTPATASERTAGSGRWLHLPSTMSGAVWFAALPFRVLQRPFERSRLGTGLVMLSRALH